MNDLYFFIISKKGLQGRKPSRQASIFAIKPMKKGKIPHLGNKKAIIPIFFVSILWFLMVRRKGLEPSRLNIRTSNVRVCLFRHLRKPNACKLYIKVKKRSIVLKQNNPIFLKRRLFFILFLFFFFDLFSQLCKTRLFFFVFRIFSHVLQV